MLPEGERIQSSQWTDHLRYPQAYRRLAQLLKKAPHPRILVFGSSLGHECVTVLAHLPLAQVVGCEIADEARAIAQITNNHGRLLYCAPRELDGMGTYDAILCHSVLCHHPRNSGKASNEHWTFKAFVAVVESLHQRLRVGGWLSLINTEYRFSDTSISANYAPDSTLLKSQVQQFDTGGNAIESLSDPILWKRRL